MIIKGKIHATSNIEVVYSFIKQGAQAIYMGDPMDTDPHGIRFCKAASLVPSYAELGMFVDGRQKDFAGAYKHTLRQKAANEMFASIIGSLYMGANIVLYFPKDVLEFGYSDILLDHFLYNFGISVETTSTAAGYDEGYDMFNAQLLYAYNIINGVDYVMIVDTLDPVTIGRLRQELCEKWHIPVNVDDMTFVKLVGDYKDKLLSCRNQGVQMPLFTKMEV